MNSRPPRATRTDTPFPSTTLFRSQLRDRRDPKEVPVGIDRHALVGVRIAIALGEQDLAVLGDGNGGARNVAARKRRSHEPIQPRFDISAGERPSAGFQAFRRIGRIAGRRRTEEHTPALQSLRRHEYTVYRLIIKNTYTA